MLVTFRSTRPGDSSKPPGAVNIARSDDTRPHPTTIAAFVREHRDEVVEVFPHVGDQFGREHVDTLREGELCVPSTL
jgi:hypothetical protein